MAALMVGARRSFTLVVAALVALVLMASAARADVLVNQPRKKACFQVGIRVGVWYQSYSGGAKWFKIHIYRVSNDKLVWSKSGKATTTWQYWHFYPNLPGHFRVAYDTEGGKSVFNVYRYGCE